MALLRSLQDRFRGGYTQETVLVDAARRGSHAAFDALARRHESRLRGFLARQVGPQAAEDVLQETWIAGWTALPHFAGRAGFKAWLYGIAIHKCRDYQRRQSRAAPTREIAPTHAPGWENHLVLQIDVREALAQLPPAQREVLELYYDAELTLAEIAQVLDRNLNTVKYQFYRAHAQAAVSLSEPGGTAGE